MDVSIQKSDLDSIGRPSYPGAYPPFYLRDYCEKALLKLESLAREDRGRHIKRRQIDLLCGLADNMFRLGVSKGATAVKKEVIANLSS